MLEEKEIGKNIRALRMAVGYSLVELSNRTGLSKGYLSKLENSPKAPPLATLFTIAEALSVTLTELLGEDQNQISAAVVKANERRPMARNETAFGYYYEALAHKYPHKRMQPYLLTFKVKGAKPMISRHVGEEMLMVLQGTLRFTHGEDEYLLEEGDCIYFDSGVEHHGVVVGEEEVKCLVVIFVPEGHAVSR